MVITSGTVVYIVLRSGTVIGSYSTREKALISINRDKLHRASLGFSPDDFAWWIVASVVDS